MYIMPSEAIKTVLPWFISISILTTLVVLIILCACKKRKESNSHAINERALPDIPIHDLNREVTGNENNITSVENASYYAPVTKAVRPKAHNPNKPHAPSPPVAANASQSSKVSSSPTNSIPNSSNNASIEYSSPNISHMYAEVQRHPKNPYEKLKGQSDSDHDTDEYDDPDKFRRNRKQWPNFQSDLYEPPPVPEKQNIYDDDLASIPEISHNQEQDEDLSNTIAGQAVAGNVASAEIPYMTPPVSQSNIISIVTSQEENNFQEAPYTIISVREPLAKVRQQTKQKGRVQDYQAKYNENENYYSEVTEEEQMYAEINSAQETAQFSDQRNLELPPAPPTVESLKSVAQAHSRQASIASTSSSGSCVPNVLTSGTSAPSPTDMNGLYSVVDKSNKQRKTIHLGEGASLLNFNEAGTKIEDMYAKVRKKRVQSVRCSSDADDSNKFEGVSDDVFNVSTPVWIPRSPNGEEFFPNTNLYVPAVPVHSIEADYPPKDWNENVEPGYEAIKNQKKEESEPDYEKVREDCDDPLYEKIRQQPQNGNGEPTYEKLKQRTNRKTDEIEQSRIDSNASINNCSGSLEDSDPGYEEVKKIQRSDSDATDPGYEAVKRSLCDDPDYESVKVNNNIDSNGPNNYKITQTVDFNGISSCDESEPGYESVRHNENLPDDEDPDYERVHRAESEVDPGYERVGQHNVEDPDYEKVQHCESDFSDPNYERIDREEIDFTEPGYETVKYDQENIQTDTSTRPNSFPNSSTDCNSRRIEVSIYSKYTRTHSCSELTNSDEQGISISNENHTELSSTTHTSVIINKNEEVIDDQKFLTHDAFQ
ncbi:uncharacterized protein [Centruroides vittatus]|uniref:uncharacterized protein isoform X1 n=1 Tax=Centruroides vittatus TaxID=120091 RepID=UPI00350EA12B